MFEGNKITGLPCDCLLTREFYWYGVEFKECDKAVTKEFLDTKSLAQSHLKVEKDGT